jgi:hypothetical protein
MRSEGDQFLPIADGEGNHAKHGGGVTAVTYGLPARTADARAIYPSTTLRVVPLPIAGNGEEQ